VSFSVPENEGVLRACAEDLRAEAAACRSGNDGLDLTTATVSGGPAGGRLAEYARNVGADVVVVGGAEPGDGSRTAFGSVGAALAAATAVPVLVVRPPVRYPAPAPRQPHVTAVCDDGATSARVLHAAFDFAANWGAAVAVVHVERRARGLVRGVARHVFGRQLRGCAALYPQVSARVSAVVEHPAQAVLAVSRDAGLVVVGDRGRRLGHGLATGTVSHTALHRARSSVALV
jgi:nucleotide-binding universal stress UspA family protein